MPRYRLIIEYDGSAFAGWQTQTYRDNAATAPRAVQNAIENALFGLTQTHIRIGGAGRTDAGVHATHQVAHCDLPKEWRADRLRDGLNALMRRKGDRVAILSASAVPDDFNARFSAVRRHYLYRILNRRAPSPLDAARVWHIPRALDLALMQEAAAVFIGKHDFTTFRSTECQAKSPVKTLDVLSVARVGEEIHVNASARSFLHNQVRSLVGTIAEAGWKRFSIDDVRAALKARDRARCGTVAPPQGLYLCGVDYATDEK